MPDLPAGTVTFLFTDIEGSTRRWEADRLGMQSSLARHDTVLRETIERHGGYVFKTVGDAFCAAFATVPVALAAALDAQQALAAESWNAAGPLRVRMAVHAGVAEERDADYFGPAVNRVARLLAAGHGGQVLLSSAVMELARDALPESTSLRDLGEHRLKDLFRAERIYQLVAPDLPAQFPPLATLDHRPNNLPPQPTPFVGRERDVAAVRDLMERDGVRLLTLTGPGGTGKTRLSLQVASDLIDAFADGVFFVALAPVDDPALVPAAIAQALGVREAGEQPLTDALTEYLRAKHVLLVLDNFEHITAAGQLVAELLRTCPLLKILVSSRHALHLAGEREFAVSPLDLPDRVRLPPLDRLTQYEAVRLFVERAQAVRADFEVTNDNAPAVAEICHRLDGLPLALELAAARAKALSPQAILARLDSRLKLLTGGARDLPARQQTLRNAIAWSHDLLTPEEQRLFRRLSVFAGGGSFAAAEDVCDPDGELDVLDGLLSLVDKSLVRPEDDASGEPRFAMLQTIREYGQEQLAESGEDKPLQAAHFACFLAFAEAAESEPAGPGQAAWLGRLEAEHDNLRAALGWAMDQADPADRLRLVNVLWRFWFIRGHLSEGRTWLERALTNSDDAPMALRARALIAAGGLASEQGDVEQAIAHIDEALTLFRGVADQRGIMLALNNLGVTVQWRGDIAWAAALHEEQVTLARELRNKDEIARALNNLGNVRYMQGDLMAAVALQEESLTLCREVGDQGAVAIALISLGTIVDAQGDAPRAEELYEEALSLSREVGHAQVTAVGLTNLGDLAHQRGDLARAASLFDEALTVHSVQGDKLGTARVLANLGGVASDRGDHRQAVANYRESLAAWQEIQNLDEIASCLDGLGAVAARTGHAETGARLHGVAAMLRESGGGNVQRFEQARHEDSVEAVRQLLTPAAFAAAWEAGRAMPLDDAIALARAVAVDDADAAR